jgi:hypothetical protein
VPRSAGYRFASEQHRGYTWFGSAPRRWNSSNSAASGGSSQAPEAVPFVGLQHPALLETLLSSAFDGVREMRAHFRDVESRGWRSHAAGCNAALSFGPHCSMRIVRLG